MSSHSLLNLVALNTSDEFLHLRGYIGRQEREGPLVVLLLKDKHFDLPSIFIIEMKELAGSSCFIFRRPTEPGSGQLRHRSQINRYRIENRTGNHAPEQFRMAEEFHIFKNGK